MSEESEDPESDFVHSIPHSFATVASQKKDQVINYARGRACFRSGEIRVLDSKGNVERTIAFSEADRKL